MARDVHGNLQALQKTRGGFGIAPITILKKAASMKPMTILAVLLIVAGIASMAYMGITYTTQEKVVDVGALHITANKSHSIPLPPIVGTLAIVGGVLLLAFGRRDS